jgi:hypothetical protein
VARRSNKEILAAAKAGIELLAMQIRDNEQLPGIREVSQHMASPQNDGTVPTHLRLGVTMSRIAAMRSIGSVPQLKIA